MAKLLLPNDLRPRHARYKHCELGVDLPSSFVHDIQGLDECLFPVFHPYRILWDDITNEYAGPLDDPRYTINVNTGQMVFGFVLTNGQGEPSPDGTWHLWRLCRDRGWAHVINIDSKDPGYLNLLVRRLWLQDTYNKKYGFRGYQRLMEEADLKKRADEQDSKQELMDEIHEVNSAMLTRARQNFEYGRTAPTNPMKETIMSGGGLTNHSKIIRPMEDREGGLILPDGLGER